MSNQESVDAKTDIESEPGFGPETSPKTEAKRTEARKSQKGAIAIAVIFVILFVAASIGYVTLSQQVSISNAKIDFSDGGSGSTSSETDTNQTNDTSSGSAQTSSVQKAPDFTVLDANGNDISLKELFGKPIVLNFWASLCGPCQKEMPDFQAAYEKYGDDIQFVMVNFTEFNGESVDHAKEYLAQNDYTFPVYFDTDSSAIATYGITSIPRTFLIDADGNIVASAIGALNERALVEGIEQLLNS